MLRSQGLLSDRQNSVVLPFSFLVTTILAIEFSKMVYGYSCMRMKVSIHALTQGDQPDHFLKRRALIEILDRIQLRPEFFKLLRILSYILFARVVKCSSI